MACTPVTSFCTPSPVLTPPLLLLQLCNFLDDETASSRVCKLAHTICIWLSVLFYLACTELKKEKKKNWNSCQSRKRARRFLYKVWLSSFPLKAKFEGTCPEFPQATCGWSGGVAVSFRQIHLPLPVPQQVTPAGF